jgi:signal transduction histidine kinase/CheY-like chemotaxis protein
LAASEPAPRASLRRVACVIFGSAFVLGAGLFAFVILLTRQHYYSLAAVVMLFGTVVITAATLYAWQTASEMRLQALLRKMQETETAKAEAEAASHQTQRLLATMSHEIRTPLNGVIGMLNLLLETPLSAEQKNYAETSHASGRTLLSIIDEVLDTAKARNPGESDTKSAVLRPIVESVTELLAARAHAKSIEISSYVAPDVPQHIAMSELHVRQILFNLAGNAIKFTEKGGVATELTITSAGLLEIVVRDTGIGMSESECRLVFEDFRQANAGTARKFGGTGLGLGIASSLIEQHGGTITVSSKPGEGTAFCARLPVAKTDHVQASTVLAGQHFHLALSRGFQSDNLAKALADSGASISMIASTAELKSVLNQKGSPANLIADTSYAATLREWARQQDKVPDPAKQVWTMLMPEERRIYPDLLQRPFVGYLLKPFRMETVQRQLARVDAKEIDRATSALRTIASKAKASRRLRVLVADDNPINLLLTRTMLDKQGHRVTTATNGQQALDQLVKSAFDLLLLDIEMPGLDGYETARRIRQLESAENRPRLPVIALTAHMRQQDLDQCLAAGMDKYLVKPFDQHDLMEVLNGVQKLKKAS